MKKIAFLGLFVFSIFALAACGNSDITATAEFSDLDIAFDRVTFDVTVTDENSEITGEIFARLLDEDGDVLDSTPLTIEEGETSVSRLGLQVLDLDPETDYELVVIATIGRRNEELTSVEFKTQVEGEILISTAEEFFSMGSNKSGTFVLQNDIDFSDVDFATPFPSGRSFSGSFDGQGYTLSNITIDQGAAYAGVFAYISSGSVNNLVLDNVQLGSSEAPLEVSSSSKVGILAGNASSASSSFENITIRNSAIYYNSSASYDFAQFYIGGFVGELRGTANNITVSDITIETKVSGTSRARVGGNVGYIYDDASIKQASATGDIKVVLDGESFGDGVSSTLDVGGFAGRNDSINGINAVEEVYSVVDLDVSVDYNTLESAESAIYSVNVGGLVGYSSKAINQAFAGGSISVSHTSSENDGLVSKLFSIGGIFGNYFGGALDKTVRYADGSTIVVDLPEDTNYDFSELIGYDQQKRTHVYGIYGVQNATVNGVVQDDEIPVIDDLSSYFDSSWTQSAYDGVQPLD